MILADSSVWIDHLGRGDPILASLLDAEQVVMHAYVLGEIALGSLRDRQRVFRELHKLPATPLVRPDELLLLIDRRPLHGTGIGYVDAHLLASTLLAPGTRLWTRDKRLRAAAERLGVAVKLSN